MFPAYIYFAGQDSLNIFKEQFIRIATAISNAIVRPFVVIISSRVVNDRNEDLLW